MVDHFTFLKSVAHAVPKLTIPAPAMLHLRGGRRAISREHYPDLAEFWADAAAAYRVAIGHIAAAGCTYLQLDDVSFAYLCDPKVREGLRAAGDDPVTLPRTYAEAINRRAGRSAGGDDRDHAHLSRELPQHVAGRRPLRGRRAGGDVLDRRLRVLHGVGQRPRRWARAATPRARATRRSCSVS